MPPQQRIGRGNCRRRLYPVTYFGHMINALVSSTTRHILSVDYAHQNEHPSSAFKSFRFNNVGVWCKPFFSFLQSAWKAKIEKTKNKHDDRIFWRFLVLVKPRSSRNRVVRHDLASKSHSRPSSQRLDARGADKVIHMGFPRLEGGMREAKYGAPIVHKSGILLTQTAFCNISSSNFRGIRGSSLS